VSTGITTMVGYGLVFHDDSHGWLCEEVRDDLDYEYVVPWMQCIDEDDPDSLHQHLLRYLLHNLPEAAPGDEILDWSEDELNDLLEERTGLKVESFGYEWSRTAVVSVKSENFYGYTPGVLTEETVTVTPSEKRWIAWVAEVSRVTLLDKPGLKILVSYG
jgi:hypothetical protein